MNEEQPSQEKDFHSLISQMANYSEVRDKMLCEIDEIIDRFKNNRVPTAIEKDALAPDKNPIDVVSRFRNLIRGMDLANERIAMIIRRLNELV